jgi:hypothetical protein
MPYSNHNDKMEAQRCWRRKRREWALEYLGGVCVECGATENLEFHHKAPAEKEFNISPLLSRQKEILIEELNKCELRCSDHHKKEHATEHGKRWMWVKGCRCDLCVEAARQHRAKYYTTDKRRDKYVRRGT